MTSENKAQKWIEGLVTSNKMDKTVVVKVARKQRHPQFGGKVVNKFTKYYAHDEENRCQLGDRVRIVECRPLSKTKIWTLVEVITSGQAS